MNRKEILREIDHYRKHLTNLVMEMPPEHHLIGGMLAGCVAILSRAYKYMNGDKDRNGGGNGRQE